LPEVNKKTAPKRRGKIASVDVSQQLPDVTETVEKQVPMKRSKKTRAKKSNHGPVSLKSDSEKGSSKPESEREDEETKLPTEEGNVPGENLQVMQKTSAEFIKSQQIDVSKPALKESGFEKASNVCKQLESRASADLPHQSPEVIEMPEKQMPLKKSKKTPARKNNRRPAILESDSDDESSKLETEKEESKLMTDEGNVLGENLQVMLKRNAEFIKSQQVTKAAQAPSKTVFQQMDVSKPTLEESGFENASNVFKKSESRVSVDLPHELPEVIVMPEKQVPLKMSEKTLVKKKNQRPAILESDSDEESSKPDTEKKQSKLMIDEGNVLGENLQEMLKRSAEFIKRQQVNKPAQVSSKTSAVFQQIGVSEPAFEAYGAKAVPNVFNQPDSSALAKAASTPMLINNDANKRMPTLISNEDKDSSPTSVNNDAKKSTPSYSSTTASAVSGALYRLKAEKQEKYEAMKLLRQTTQQPNFLGDIMSAQSSMFVSKQREPTDGKPAPDARLVLIPSKIFPSI
jgi:hypothetical protein